MADADRMVESLRAIAFSDDAHVPIGDRVRAMRELRELGVVEKPRGDYYDLVAELSDEQLLAEVREIIPTVEDAAAAIGDVKPEEADDEQLAEAVGVLLKRSDREERRRRWPRSMGIVDRVVESRVRRRLAEERERWERERQERSGAPDRPRALPAGDPPQRALPAPPRPPGGSRDGPRVHDLDEPAVSPGTPIEPGTDEWRETLARQWQKPKSRLGWH